MSNKHDKAGLTYSRVAYAEPIPPSHFDSGRNTRNTQPDIAENCARQATWGKHEGLSLIRSAICYTAEMSG